MPEEDDAPQDDALTQLIGTRTSSATVEVERGPVAGFAVAVCDNNPIYKDARAADAAGFDAIPAPPTYPFVIETWGRFPELQPPDAPAAGGGMAKVLGPLMAKGGIILHGEQSFEYHRPVLVGDVLDGEGTVVDAYTKESKGRTMTFVVSETVWRDRTTGEPVVTSRFNVIHRA
ncbi:MAG: MaoC family dehydratase N-terminal domain-containing protein [Acidimicrobiales bacterium]